MIQTYFLNSRDKNISDKLDPNGYAIVAKHLVVMASVASVKDCMVTFWSHMDQLLVQTVIDCDSKATRAPFDMDIFCQKTGHLLTAISREIEQANNPEKYATLSKYTNDLAKRLLLTCLESSLVHKNKSFGLLVLACQLISNYREACIETKGVVHAAEQLLVMFSEGDENAAAEVSFASFYVTLVSAIKDKSEAKELWNQLMKKLNGMSNTDGLQLRGAKILLLVLEQIQTEKLVLDFDYQCDDLDSLVETCALVKLNEAAIVVPRPILESIVSLSLTHYLCKVDNKNIERKKKKLIYTFSFQDIIRCFSNRYYFKLRIQLGRIQSSSIYRTCLTSITRTYCPNAQERTFYTYHPSKAL